MGVVSHLKKKLVVSHRIEISIIGIIDGLIKYIMGICLHKLCAASRLGSTFIKTLESILRDL